MNNNRPEVLEPLRKAASSYHTGVLLQQPTGMFTMANMERAVISTQVVPEGIGAYIPAFPNNTDDPRYGIWTGYGATTGTEPDYPCDTAPTSLMKSGALTSVFGRLQRATNTIEAGTIALTARNSTSDLMLIGAAYNGEHNLLNEEILKDPNQLLNYVVSAEMAGVGVQMERLLSTLVWQGNPSNNSAHGGYKEFNGLDLLIKTGHVDADTSTAMAAADSLIVSWADDVDAQQADIVKKLSNMMFYLENLAKKTRLNPVQFAICMPAALFFELSAIWACRYMTDGCYVDGQTIVSVSNDTAAKLRWDMYENSYLMIGGRKYPVVVDDGMVETEGDGDPVPEGKWIGDIAILPLVVAQRIPSLHFEFVNYKELSPMLSAIGQATRQLSFWSDGGRVLWSMDGAKTCFQLQANMQPRLVLRTPHLAAKLEDVYYQPDIDMRSPFPSDSRYAAGGVQTR